MQGFYGLQIVTLATRGFIPSSVRLASISFIFNCLQASYGIVCVVWSTAVESFREGLGH